MKKRALFTVIASTFTLAACGGGGGGGGNETPRPTVKTDVNVAAKANGATAVALYNPASASNLIDGDLNTSWVSDPDTPILISFAATENIKKIKLSRVAAGASIGSNPDILVELSADGLNYTASNMSVVNGGIACSSMSNGQQVMECSMGDVPTRAVRITSKNGKAFEFLEFEAIAYK